jgi:hypothetical protein
MKVEEGVSLIARARAGGARSVPRKSQIYKDKVIVYSKFPFTPKQMTSDHQDVHEKANKR